MIDKLTAEKIKDTARILDVVSDYVKLTRSGANYKGLCPFHNERTPSFSVNIARNYCHCFSCHKGGSPVNFIMEKEGIGYQDALRQLARRYGIKIEEKELSEEDRKAQTHREQLFMVNEWAMKTMQHWLEETDEGKEIGLRYFYERGVEQKSVKRFGLGYSPDSNVLEELARKEGFDTALLHELGLVGTSGQGRSYDRFRGRVMFPVRNSAGKVVAFGGRDLKGKSPAKYVNSPESPIYKKSNELYGIYQARSSIVKEDKCFLVEGYLDVIGMWQSGFENTVASSGTALTDAQIALIHRFTSNVTLIYDGDAAGIKASLRGIDLLLSHNLNLKVLLLPEGHDPDSFARANTPETFKEYIKENEVDFITYKAKALMLDVSQNDPQAKAQVANAMVESIACVSDKVRRSIYVQECSLLLDVDEQALNYAVNNKRLKVVEQIKIERERKNIPVQDNAGTLGGESAENEKGGSGFNSTEQETVVSSSAKEVASTAAGTTNSILISRTSNEQKLRLDLEKRLVRYCVRFGMMEISLQEENAEIETGRVLDVITSELQSDCIEIVSPLNKKMLFAMNKLKENYDRDFAIEVGKRKEQETAEFEEGMKALFDRALDPVSLEREESALHDSIEDRSNEIYRDFASEYLFSRLINHEDSDIRNYAVEMGTDKYELSKYHAKTGKVELEIDRIADLVPRTLNELRQQLVEMDCNELRRQIKTASPEEQLELMKELQSMQELRKEFAEAVGGRIVRPRQR